MSGFFMTEEAYKYVEEHQDHISYEVIKSESTSTSPESLLLEENT